MLYVDKNPESINIEDFIFVSHLLQNPRVRNCCSRHTFCGKGQLFWRDGVETLKMKVELGDSW